MPFLHLPQEVEICEITSGSTLMLRDFLFKELNAHDGAGDIVESVAQKPLSG